MAGIRAEFVFQQPGDCPVASASEETDGPVTDVSWAAGSDGTTTEQFVATGPSRAPVTLHATDMADLGELIGELEERYGEVRREYLVRGKADAEEADLVPVDMRTLTDRQREVLATAHEMGYFDYRFNFQ